MNILFLMLLSLFFGSLMADEELVKENLQNILPKNISIKEITFIKEIGFYKVYIGEPEPFYVDKTGSFFFYGDLFKIQDQNKLINLTDIDIKRNIAKIISSSIPENEKIYFRSDIEKFNITVFTDVDCAYCRKFHSKIFEYNEYGISIGYVAFPRSGPDSEVGKKMSKVWCYDNRKLNLTSAKQDKNFISNKCDDNTVFRHYNIGNKIGITGTPTLISDEGDVFPGYISPTELINILERE